MTELPQPARTPPASTGAQLLLHPSTTEALTTQRQLRSRVAKAQGRRRHRSCLVDTFRLAGSCLPQILPAWLLLVLWASLLYTISIFYLQDYRWSLSHPDLVASLSWIPLALILIVRNAAWNRRRQEARRIWATATADAGMLARYLWAHVQVDVVASDATATAEGSTQAQGHGDQATGLPPFLQGHRQGGAVSPHAPDNMSHHRIQTPSMIFDRIYDVSSEADAARRPSSAAGASASTSNSDYGSGAWTRPLTGAADTTSGALQPPSVPPPPPLRPSSQRSASPPGPSEEDISRRVAKKRRAIRLLILFFQSTSHELNGELGIEWPDYQGILPDDMRAFWNQSASISQQSREDDALVGVQVAPLPVGSDLEERGEEDDDEGAGEDQESDDDDDDEGDDGEDEEGDGDGDGEDEDGETGEATPSTSSAPAVLAVPVTWPLFAWFDSLRSREKAAHSRNGQHHHHHHHAVSDETTPLLPTHVQAATAPSPSGTITAPAAVAVPIAVSAPASTDVSTTQAGPPTTRAGMSLSLLTLFELGRYIVSARKAGMLNDAGPAGTSLASEMLQSLSRARSALQLLLLDVAEEEEGGYSADVHLRLCTRLYLALLPVALLFDCTWRVIPLTALLAFLLLGLEGSSSSSRPPYSVHSTKRHQRRKNSKVDEEIEEEEEDSSSLLLKEFRCQMEGLILDLPEGADVRLCL